MRDKLYVVVFALMISAVASIVLTFANSVLKERIRRNQQLEIYSSVLEVLGIEVDETADFRQIESAFNAHTELISEETIEAGEIRGLDIYKGIDENGNLIGYAMRIHGAGFWGPVKGFLAVETDLRTVKGIIFYEQEETPGLGGRIVEDEFRSQFIGKQIYGDGEEKPGLLLTPPAGRMFDPELVAKKRINEVDAITGATETSSALQRFMNKGLENFQIIMREKGLE